MIGVNPISDIVYEKDSVPYGEPYGSWTVKWWQWLLAIPLPVNPVTDWTGEHFQTTQTNPNVVFLVGKLADMQPEIPMRSCTISSQKSILVPVINCECNRLEDPSLQTERSIVERAASDEDTIIYKSCLLDGLPIPPQRVKSVPVLFELFLAEDNIFNVKEGGRTLASADGFWVFLKPLSKGKHTISFQGSCEKGKLNTGAIYHLEVL
jgi:hypothetical protein